MKQQQATGTAKNTKDQDHQIIQHGGLTGKSQDDGKSDAGDAGMNCATQKVYDGKKSRYRWLKLFFIRLTRLSPDRMIELVIALAILVLSVVQYRTILENNNSTTKQTQQLITAAKMSAHSADHNATAATSFAKSADSINTEVTQAVEKLGKQAESTKKLVDKADAQASAELAIARGNIHGNPRLEIKKMNIFRQSDKPYVDIEFTNAGEAAAWNPKVAARIAFRKTAPTFNERSLVGIQFKPIATSTLQVGVRGDLVVPRFEGMPPQSSDEKYVYVWGRVRYTDSLGQISRDEPFCKFAPSSEILSKPQFPPNQIPQNPTNQLYEEPYRDCEVSKPLR